MPLKLIPTLLCLAGSILRVTTAYDSGIRLDPKYRDLPDVVSTGHYDFDNVDYEFDANGTFIARSYTVNMREGISAPHLDAHLLWVQDVLDVDTEDMLEVRRRNRDVLTDPDDQDWFYIVRPDYYWRVQPEMKWIDYYGVFACARTAFFIYNNPDVSFFPPFLSLSLSFSCCLPRLLLKPPY